MGKMMTMTPSDTELYREHADELTRYATVLVGPDDAPDVVIDAVLAAFASPGWRRVEHPRAYLFRAVLNTANSRHRSAGRRRRRESVVALQERPSDAREQEAALDVHRALGTLSPQQRESCSSPTGMIRQLSRSPRRSTSAKARSVNSSPEPEPDSER